MSGLSSGDDRTQETRSLKGVFKGYNSNSSVFQHNLVVSLNIFFCIFKLASVLAGQPQINSDGVKGGKQIQTGQENWKWLVWRHLLR